MKSFVSLLALLLALIGCSRPDPIPAPSAGGAAGGRPPLRYLALGDSYTIGEGVDPAQRWPVQLAARMRARGITLADPMIIARTGWTTGDLSSAIDEVMPRGPFDLVTILIGVNDQYRGVDPELYRRQLSALLVRATAFAGGHPRRVIVVSIPDWGVTPFAAGRDRNRVGREIDQFNAVAAHETAAAGCRWVDVTAISRTVAKDESLVVADGLHPSARMYERWVALIDPEAVAAVGR